MNFPSDSIQQVHTLIHKAERIVITTHVSPDGDAMGSSLALYHVLKKAGKQVTVITPNAQPRFLTWLQDADKTLAYDQIPEESSRCVEESDLIFCLDFNDLKRLDTFEPLVSASQKPMVVVDHHQQPKDFATVLISDESKSSTCEMIFDLIEDLGWIDKIDKDTANCIFTGLSTDTGFFRHNCTTARVHRIAAHLIELGAENTKVVERINDTNSVSRLKLLGYALSQKMTHWPEFKTVVFDLNAEELRQFGYQEGDTEGLVNYGLSIEGVVFSVFFKESADKIKISFRSKGDFSAQAIAKEYFNGGGHYNASGGAFYGSISQAKELLYSVLK